MQTTKIKFRKLFDLFERGISPEGQPIYEWEYIDPETGNIKTDKRNVFEQIQSYAGRVDYKTQIEKGEFVNGELKSTYQDYRGIPDTSVGLIDHLNYLANLPKEQVTDLLEQIAKANQASISTKQTDNQTTNGTTTSDTTNIQE